MKFSSSLLCLLLISLSGSRAKEIQAKLWIPGNSCSNVRLPALPGTQVQYRLLSDTVETFAGLTFAVSSKCKASWGSNGCQAGSTGAGVACIAATAGLSSGGDLSGVYTSPPRASPMQLFIRNTASAGRQLELLVVLQQISPRSIGPQFVEQVHSTQLPTTNATSGNSDVIRLRLTHEAYPIKLRGYNRKLLANSDATNAANQVKMTKINYSNYINDIVNRVPPKNRKGVKIAIIVAIVLACLVLLCCLWCLIKCICCPFCC